MERKHVRIRKEKRMKKIILLFIVLVLVITFSVFGRYIYYQAREAYFTSKAF